jgi:hypothetical protein
MRLHAWVLPARSAVVACIARKAIPRVRPPDCCVQYAERGDDIESD